VQYRAQFTGARGSATVTAGATITVGHTLQGWGPSAVRAPLPGRKITITLLGKGTGVRTYLARTTDSNGMTNATVTVSTSQKVYANLSGANCESHASASAPEINVNVHKRITRTVSDSTPAVGRHLKITGSVYPAKPGQKVYLQRWTGTRFVNLVAVSTTTAGAYTTYYKPDVTGRHILRLYTPFDGWNIASVSSNIVLSAH
jgi:hypothetical protein